MTVYRYCREGGHHGPVDPKGVILSDGTWIDATYVILASGSPYPYLAKMRTDDSAAVLGELASTRSQLAGLVPASS